MLIFLVVRHTGAEFFHKAEDIISEIGGESYSAKKEFFPDGVQDPYRAVDESDVIVWVECVEPNSLRKTGEYNPLYGNSVLNRAVAIGKPVLYYQIVQAGSAKLAEMPEEIAKPRTAESLSAVEVLLRADLSEIVSG